MSAILELPPPELAAAKDVEHRLPSWFVEACAPEESKKEALQWLERWRALPPAEQAAASARARWSLLDWLYWMDPARREWHWWDAQLVDQQTLKLLVEVDSWPAPLGAVEWLLRASGALELKVMP